MAKKKKKDLRKLKKRKKRLRSLLRSRFKRMLRERSDSSASSENVKIKKRGGPSVGGDSQVGDSSKQRNHPQQL